MNPAIVLLVFLAGASIENASADTYTVTLGILQFSFCKIEMLDITKMQLETKGKVVIVKEEVHVDDNTWMMVEIQSPELTSRPTSVWVEGSLKFGILDPRTKEYLPRKVNIASAKIPIAPQNSLSIEVVDFPWYLVQFKMNVNGNPVMKLILEASFSISTVKSSKENVTFGKPGNLITITAPDVVGFAFDIEVNFQDETKTLTDGTKMLDDITVSLVSEFDKKKGIVKYKVTQTLVHFSVKSTLCSQGGKRLLQSESDSATECESDEKPARSTTGKTIVIILSVALLTFAGAGVVLACLRYKGQSCKEEDCHRDSTLEL